MSAEGQVKMVAKTHLFDLGSTNFIFIPKGFHPCYKLCQKEHLLPAARIIA